jgi:hypothetical protein
MLTDDMQKANEYRFARHHVDKYMRDYVLNDVEVIPLLDKGVEILTEWVNTEFSYESKNIRVSALKGMDLRELVTEVVVASAYCQHEELFTSFTARMAGILGWDDKKSSITTVAEITAVLCDTDLFDLTQANRFSSWNILSNITLSLELQEYIANCAYLPPLVHKPSKLRHNRDTPYLTIGQDSVILNKGHHNDDVCLDVLDSKNAVALSLDLEFLSTVEEEPNSELDSPEKQNMWLRMKKQSHEFYLLMAKQGNKFYLHHKYDKRGRIYAQGYHISTQGAPYKKAMIEFANKEAVTDIPQEFQL